MDGLIFSIHQSKANDLTQYNLLATLPIFISHIYLSLLLPAEFCPEDNMETTEEKAEGDAEKKH